MPGRKTLLLVEDDADTRELFVELLSEEYEVLAASSAEQALPLARQTSSLFAVITDHTLPGKSGAQLAVMLKEELAVSVILISGHRSPPGSEVADLVLEKPVELDGLFAALNSLAERPSDADSMVASPP